MIQRNLVHHVFGAVAAGKLPEQPPVDQFERIEGPVGTAVEERAPVNVLRGAVGRHGAHPLALAVRRIAAHPGFNLRDLADPSVFDHLLGVELRAGTLMLQSDLHDAVRSFRGRHAFVRLRNRPGHGFFRIQVLSCSQRIEKMTRMNVQRAGHDDSVDVFHVEQAAVIVESLDTRDFILRLIAAAAIDIGHGHEFHAVNRANLPQQVVAAIAHADHAHADAVVRAQHLGSWIRQHGGRSQRGLLQKSTPALLELDLLGHNFSSCVTMRRLAAEVSSFPPSSGATILPPNRRRASEFPDSRRSGSHRA